MIRNRQLVAISTGTAVLIGTITVLLGGCSRDDSASPNQAAWESTVQQLIQSAESAGATEDQLAMLRSHLETGEAISFEEYRGAVLTTIDCAEAAGASIDGPEQSQQNGLPTLTFGYGGPEDASFASIERAVETCRTTNSEFIEYAYLGGPRALDWIDAQFNAYRPQLLECLRRYGTDVDDDVSRDEIETAVADLIASEPDFSGPNCMVESGLSDVLGRLG